MKVTYFPTYEIVDHKKLQPPVDNKNKLWNTNERKSVEVQLFTSIMGDAVGVRQQLNELIKQTGPNEIMAHTEIFDHQARLRSYEIFAHFFMGFEGCKQFYLKCQSKRKMIENVKVKKTK